MFYVGLDLHVTHITICILDKHGNIHERCQVNSDEQLIERLARLTKFEVCFEASTTYGHYHELLSKLASRVAVAHPGLLRLIYRSKKKNDRADAYKLAKLLFINEVPQVHVPTADVRAWRELITFRKRLIEKRTRAKNALRCILRSLGIKAPKEHGLWTKKGIAWLEQLEFAQPLHAVKRDMLIEELRTLSKQVLRVEQELANFSKDNPAIAQLRTIPGIGLRTAEAVACRRRPVGGASKTNTVAFIDDPHRFANSKRLGSYFGLVPSQDQSGKTNRLGHITKEGSATVRAMLCEATWQAIRRSPTVRAYQERIQRGEKDRKKISVTATAHYLVRVMWSMLKNGTVWRERVLASTPA